MENKFLAEAKAIAPYLEGIYKQIHSHPELGRQEYETQALILKELAEMGIEAQKIADTGVLGIIRGGKPGKTVAFRADMDALPIEETADVPYKSQNPGVMHACGHDSHVTILLGLAKIMSTKKAELSGNIKLLFQPDEEGRGGAKRMIEEGCMENPHVDGVFYSHCSPGTPTGTISSRFGSVNAASNTFTVTFRGKGSHGASPHLGTDVIVAASNAVMALQTISSRRVAATDSIVVTVGSFQAGTAPNILPETATLKGMIRTLNPKTREQAKNDFCQIINGVAATMNVEVDIDLRDGYCASVNDDDMTRLTRAAAAKVLGEENVRTIPAPSLGTEDFGYFLQEAPGCYYNYGVGKPSADNKPTHNPGLKLDLNALPYGAAVYAQIAEDFLSE